MTTTTTTDVTCVEYTRPSGYGYGRVCGKPAKFIRVSSYMDATDLDLVAKHGGPVCGQHAGAERRRRWSNVNLIAIDSDPALAQRFATAQSIQRAKDQEAKEANMAREHAEALRRQAAIQAREAQEVQAEWSVAYEPRTDVKWSRDGLVETAIPAWKLVGGDAFWDAYVAFAEDSNGARRLELRNTNGTVTLNYARALAAALSQAIEAAETSVTGEAE